MTDFRKMPLLASLQETLREKGFERATEIQGLAIPALLEGKTLVGISETGSGKTLSYALPVLHKIKEIELDTKPVTEAAQPRAAILVPTRELGEQVLRVFKPFTHQTRLRVRALLGGTTAEVARRNVSAPFDILVATPGRLVKFMRAGQITLKEVRFLVFDEADQMLDPGFLPDSAHIVMCCSPRLQMALFTATLPSQVQKLISELFESPEVFQTQGSQKTVSTLTTKNIQVTDGDRKSALLKILNAQFEGSTILFTNTREQCDRLSLLLNELGKSHVVYRGEMDKQERRRNLKSFRDGKVEFLVSTDLASRGLDIQGVERVINYHLPQNRDNYLHRVGRTARAGKKGLVLNLVTERDRNLLNQL
jgi:ATP-dependent RNA helicase RhlE